MKRLIHNTKRVEIEHDTPHGSGIACKKKLCDDLSSPEYKKRIDLKQLWSYNHKDDLQIDSQLKETLLDLDLESGGNDYNHVQIRVWNKLTSNIHNTSSLHTH